MVNRIKILDELKKYPVFTIMTLGGIMDKRNDYSKLVAYRLKKSGLITQLERDKPQDIYDLWFLLKVRKLSLDKKLLRKKLGRKLEKPEVMK
jgi:hypothetical protein